VAKIKKAIKVNLREAALRRAIRRHLKNMGFHKDSDGQLVPPDLSKDTYRRLHESQRRAKLEKNMSLVNERGPTFLKHFALGKEVWPEFISPRLQLVEGGTDESALFNFASLYWRVPVSNGYGRRMRFLVWDDSNKKLIGLIGLTDPVFNLRARDGLIGWNHRDRANRLIHMMDAFVLGAVPPYNQLLGGKLIACLVRSQEVVKLFRQKYGDSRGIISRKRKDPHLVAITTSSALGRSSIYNRLKLGNQAYFQPIGFTEGFGHFHFPDDLFDDLRAYLREQGDDYSNNHEFGQGPNWRLRAIRQALHHLGMGAAVTHHGLKREVFMCKVADNALEILNGTRKRPKYDSLLSVEEVGILARARWLAPRGVRMPDFRQWTHNELMNVITENISPQQDGVPARVVRARQ
jgi:hypothetical protein